MRKKITKLIGTHRTLMIILGTRKKKYTAMKKTLLLLITIMTLGFSSARAQVNFHIGFDSVSIANDTFYLGGSVNYNIHLSNWGPSNYNPLLGDSLYIYTAVRDTAAPSVLNLVDITPVAGPPVIVAGDSIHITMSSVFTNSAVGYHRDINVIVIWPYTTGTTTVNNLDSMEFSVILLDPSGVNEIDLSRYIYLYPNPTQGQLRLENQQQSDIEQVRITDLQGRLIWEQQNATCIETGDWKPGMYLVTVTLANHRQVVLRVIRE